jgi:general L-amino acid transport system substrate-binding protein
VAVLVGCSAGGASGSDAPADASAGAGTAGAVASGTSGKSGTSVPTDAGATLAAVRARGTLRCGVAQSAGFATPDGAGRWRGLDADFCRAIAAALFGDAERVEFVPFTMQQRFSGLQSGEVDVLVNGTSMTISRALRLGFRFGPIYLYDGQAVMVPRSLGVESAKALDGATVCVQQGTTTELNLTDFARRAGIRIRPVVIEDLRGAVGALAAGRCDGITQDGAGLATTRTMLRNPGDYVILPERLSKEPIAPVVRAGDDRWLEFIRWVFWTPIQAEEFGITSANVASFAASTDPSIRRFLGVEPGVTDALGLDPRWTYRVIEAVGNYGEIYERHLGPGSPLALPRGSNRLWTDGGLLYAPPFR